METNRGGCIQCRGRKGLVSKMDAGGGLPAPPPRPGLYPVPLLAELTQRSIPLLLLNHPSCRNTYFPNKTLY